MATKKTPGKKAATKKAAKKATVKSKAKTAKAAAVKKPAASAAGKKVAKKQAARKSAQSAIKKAKPGNGKNAKTTAGSSMVSPAERQKMIELAAYLIAEKRGFHPGGELQDWVEAEKQVDNFLQSQA